MFSIRREFEISGWWFTPFMLPLVAAGVIEERRNKTVLNNHHEHQPDHEWVRVEWCRQCQTDTDFFYVEWRDDQVVTKECLSCGSVFDYVDRV